MHSVRASANIVKKFIQLLKLNHSVLLIPAKTLNNRVVVKVPLLLRNLLSDSINPCCSQKPCSRVSISCGFNLSF